LIRITKTFKIHPVFYVLVLEPYKELNIPGRTQPLPRCIEIHNYEKYEVEKILNTQQRQGELEYHIHWRNYDINKPTLEPTINVVNAPQNV